jgi:hypothetical protein
MIHQSHHINLYQLPLFAWSAARHHAPPSTPQVRWLVNRYALTPLRARVVAELAGLGV